MRLTHQRKIRNLSVREISFNFFEVRRHKSQLRDNTHEIKISTLTQLDIYFESSSGLVSNKGRVSIKRIM